MAPISDYINNNFKAIESAETITFVQDFFAAINYSHFPVIEDGVYIGCIGADDLDNFDSDKKVLNYRYALEGFFARTNMLWIEVMEIFGKIRAAGNTVVLVTHEEDIAAYAHRVVRLRDGLVETDTTK